MPGSVNDACVLANSAIYWRANNKEILQGDSLIASVWVIKLFPFFLIWDFAYSLLPWVVKPFAMSTSLSVQQKTFNYRICITGAHTLAGRVRSWPDMKVERAVRHLKAQKLRFMYSQWSP